jgi:hypothetical protein
MAWRRARRATGSTPRTGLIREIRAIEARRRAVEHQLDAVPEQMPLAQHAIARPYGCSPSDSGGTPSWPSYEESRHGLIAAGRPDASRHSW